MNAVTAALPPFQAPYAPPDEELAVKFIVDAARDGAAERRVDARARRLIAAIRAKIGGLVGGLVGGLGGVEDFLHAFSLSTKEGLALMVLAEALLRVPDAATADRLIRQACCRPLARRRCQIERTIGFGFSLDAWRRRAGHSS